jgi:hypothetical protein
MLYKIDERLNEYLLDLYQEVDEKPDDEVGLT